MEWLMEKFPGRDKNFPADAYAVLWLGYESAFETILAAWDEVRGSGRFDDTLMSCAVWSRHAAAPQGVFTVMWPGVPLPFGGLIACSE